MQKHRSQSRCRPIQLKSIDIMTTKEELQLILNLIQKHRLPLSPILEYSIMEKLEELSETEIVGNEIAINPISSSYEDLYKAALEEASRSVKIVERLVSNNEQEKLSLSQALKELKKNYWTPEVKILFENAGVNGDLTPSAFIKVIPNNIRDGRIGIWKDAKIKDVSGHYVKNEEGKIKTEKTWKKCTFFSVKILFLLLMQNGILITE